MKKLMMAVAGAVSVAVVGAAELPAGYTAGFFTIGVSATKGE